MYAKLNFIDFDNKIDIIIKQNKSIIYKVSLWLITIMLVPSCVFALFIILPKEKNVIVLITIICAVFILFIFVFKHLKVVYGVEKITLTRENFIYKNTFLGAGKSIEIKKNQIKKMEYVGYEKQIKHELDIKGDALGFEIGESEANYLNQDGTILLLSKKGKMRFGVNVAFEDFIELNLVMKRYI